MLTTRQVADLVGVQSLATVRRWVREGRLEVAARTPGGLRFTREAVERFLRDTQARPGRGPREVMRRGA